MKALLQRVSSASVEVNNETIGKIQNGFVILLGITHTDSEKDIEFLVEKIIHLRVFADEEEKMNNSLLDSGGSALVVSQFTLYADTRKGRRPAFTDAARPETAIPLYESFVASLKKHGISTETGEFGAMMNVKLVNDGPVTILLESHS